MLAKNNEITKAVKEICWLAVRHSFSNTNLWWKYRFQLNLFDFFLFPHKIKNGTKKNNFFVYYLFIGGLKKRARWIVYSFYTTRVKNIYNKINFKIHKIQCELHYSLLLARKLNATNAKKRNPTIKATNPMKS